MTDNKQVPQDRNLTKINVMDIICLRRLLCDKMTVFEFIDNNT